MDSGRKRDLSVVDVIEDRLKAAGYALFPKLLDAAWYGVPQHRTRYFLMGLHRDLGYGAEDFGDQGPYPHPSHGTCQQPLVTVKEAIRDLPRITNGHFVERSPYDEPSSENLKRNAFLRYVREGCDEDTVFDHVTSRHADYVIERYRRIRQGENWENIREMLGNYADASRTHSKHLPPTGLEGAFNHDRPLPKEHAGAPEPSPRTLASRSIPPCSRSQTGSGSPEHPTGDPADSFTNNNNSRTRSARWSQRRSRSTCSGSEMSADQDAYVLWNYRLEDQFLLADSYDGAVQLAITPHTLARAITATDGGSGRRRRRRRTSSRLLQPCTPQRF